MGNHSNTFCCIYYSTFCHLSLTWISMVPDIWIHIMFCKKSIWNHSDFWNLIIIGPSTDLGIYHWQRQEILQFYGPADKVQSEVYINLSHKQIFPKWFVHDKNAWSTQQWLTQCSKIKQCYKFWRLRAISGFF